MARYSYSLFRGGRKIGTLTVEGKSQRKANTAARGVIRNIEQGYWDGDTFHPIRSSSDYSSSRAGEGSRRKKSRKRKRKAKTRRRKVLYAGSRSKKGRRGSKRRSRKRK